VGVAYSARYYAGGDGASAASPPSWRRKPASLSHLFGKQFDPKKAQAGEVSHSPACLCIIPSLAAPG
jgi:hypothetical protein